MSGLGRLNLSFHNTNFDILRGLCFVSGRLTAEEATLFQSQLARSPELRRKVDDFSEFLLALKREVGSSEKRKTLSQVFLFLSPALALLLCVVSLCEGAA